MPESYFDIPATEQGELLGFATTETGGSASVIEKDIWLSLVLQHSFNAKPQGGGLGSPGCRPVSPAGGRVVPGDARRQRRAHPKSQDERNESFSKMR